MIARFVELVRGGNSSRPTRRLGRRLQVEVLESREMLSFSLTGDEMAENSSDISGDTVNNNDAEPQSDAGEFTIASVPLY